MNIFDVEDWLLARQVLFVRFKIEAQYTEGVWYVELSSHDIKEGQQLRLVAGSGENLNAAIYEAMITWELMESKAV